MTSLSNVFELNPQGLDWRRGVMFLDIILVPLVVLWAIGQEQYLLSAMFGAAFTGLVDPGGAYRYRASDLAVFALLGAALTALGFAVGNSDWGWAVLAAFAVTLVAGLAVRFGLHRFVAALLLNIWFVVTLAIAFSVSHAHLSSHTWGQVLAWLGGVGALDRGDFRCMVAARSQGLTPDVSRVTR